MVCIWVSRGGLWCVYGCLGLGMVCVYGCLGVVMFGVYGV